VKYTLFMKFLRDFGTALSLVATILAGVVWAVRLEGKVNSQIEKSSDLETHRLEDRAMQSHLQNALFEINSRLSRIEGKLGGIK
jgi:hypothetical protein